MTLQVSDCYQWSATVYTRDPEFCGRKVKL